MGYASIKMLDNRRSSRECRSKRSDAGPHSTAGRQSRAVQAPRRPTPKKNRGVQVRIEAIRTRCRRGPSRPALPQPSPLRLAHLRPAHFEPAHLRRVYMPLGSTRALGSERRFAGVQVVWSGLTFGTLPWPRRVGRLAGRAVGRSRPVMTGSYCPGLIAWTAVLRAVNAVHPIDYTSSNGFVRTTPGRIVVLR